MIPGQAKVTSVEALESFRASLILYLSKARPTLEEVSSEVLRTRLWLQSDRRVYWEGQIRRRTKDWEEAQQALYSARLSNLREASAAEVMVVRKTKRALEEAEAKLKLVKQWNQQFDSRLEPLLRHLERLHTMLANGLPKAVASLAQTIKTLSEYADFAPPPEVANEAQPGSPETNTQAAACGGLAPPFSPQEARQGYAQEDPA